MPNITCSSSLHIPDHHENIFGFGLFSNSLRSFLLFSLFLFLHLLAFSLNISCAKFLKCKLELVDALIVSLSLQGEWQVAIQDIIEKKVFTKGSPSNSYSLAPYHFYYLIFYVCGLGWYSVFATDTYISFVLSFKCFISSFPIIICYPVN